MKNERFFELMSGIDEDLITRAENAGAQYRKKKSLWIKWGAAAACLCLIAGLAVPLLRAKLPTVDPGQPSDGPTEGPTQAAYAPLLLDASRPPQELSGSPLEFVVGSSSSIASSFSGETAPPAFEFDVSSFVVKARVVENYPDPYYKLDVSPEYKPTAYRLVQMETVEVLHGENLPRSFLYMLPEYLFVDMSVYDSLLIAMTQAGTEGYVLRNGAQNVMEALPLPLFKDPQDHPELGNVIAFTGGVFDEGLWQTESWLYGYQFGRFYLDDPGMGDLVVSRGGTEEAAVEKIRAKIRELGDGHKIPAFITLDFTSESARSALEYVKPFENGVFSQTIPPYSGNGQLVFRRFINGCQTEETVTIDLLTQEVTWSDVRYTKEDMSALEDIAAHISEAAREYAAQTPPPPHTAPEGKELICLNLYGWYVKSNGRVYGVVKTVWKYEEENNWTIQYYDEAYTLYDAASSTARSVSRDELLELAGPRNIYQGEYGAAIELPMC